MRFLIDANLPRAAIDVCQKFGHQVEFARDIGMAAAPDEQIAARARESGAALLTRDLDFGDVRRYPPDQYQGIVVLRLPDTTVAQEIVRVLERFLTDQDRNPSYRINEATAHDRWGVSRQKTHRSGSSRLTAATDGLEMTSGKRPLSEPISYFVGGGALKRVKLAACIFQEPLSRFST